ncbi:MAG: DUF1735 domain-containing protein, partial [Tannerella sp.]|nr:DUF1735 domain-containing protein [Tannerella sp.]
MRTEIMKLIPGLPACFGRVKMIPAAAAAMKLAVLVLLAGSSFLWSCSDPVPAIELDQFMSLALSGAKETSVIKKLNLESTADTVFYITMTYGGTNNYERGEITATLDVDYSLVEAFNAANYTEYRLLPEGTYSFDRTDARIANGRNASEPVKLTLRMNALNLSFDYLLPVTVKSVSGNLPLNEEMKTLYLVFRGDVEDESGRERWTGAGASSEGENNPVENVFDGDRDTYWHSGEAGSMPQWFAVNMQGFKRIKGFTWVNCTDPAQPALPKHVQIETSMNGTEWTQALDIPELEQSRVLQVLPLEQTVVAKFFRVTVLSAWADAPYTYVAEVDIYSGQEPEGETDFAKYNWTVDGFSSELMAVWGAACAIDGT